MGVVVDGGVLQDTQGEGRILMFSLFQQAGRRSVSRRKERQRPPSRPKLCCGIWLAIVSMQTIF